ncbi:DUF2975 domain-containing protein [Marisediminicola senii]|uniref:DUF2975 domain-containing protein n=1 Tax=Marisediminicola senii TaxID=2711233 RepID=UPI0013ED6F8A|nr:DUF2975 domain-containing protein [Marisediminicola senii]
MVLVTRVALALLFIAVIAGQIVVVLTAQSMVADYPEFSDLQAPLVSAAILFGICIQVVLVITGALVGYIRDSRIFGSSSLKLVDVMAATLAIATAIVVGTLFLIPGPPALGLLVIGGALVGVTLTLVLLTLRSLLRKSASMRTELDGVV